MKKITSFLFITLFTNLSLGAQNISPSNGPVKPISFKENKGQVGDQHYKVRPDILFSGNEGDLVFHLKNDGISYQLNRVDEWTKNEDPRGRKNNPEQLIPLKSTIYRVDVDWLNTNASPEIKKGEALQGYENYYLESCPGGALQVKSYPDLTYKNLYPGIDLKWYEKNGSLEYDYYVAANADYTKIQLAYKGAETIYVNRNGELIIKTPLGILKEQKPLVVQNGRPLEARWAVKNNIISFDIKNVNVSLPLVIDPAVRLWATYYGGSGHDDVFYTYANPAGEVFISGSTVSSANIATTGAYQTTFGGGTAKGDGYLVKFDPSGTRLWATYYGGSGNDYAGESIADASGNVFLTGGTQSGSPGVIATAGAFQTVYSTAATNTGDAFLVMFNSSGVRQWGTYYGGDDNDLGNGIALDNSGNIFISGASQSTNNIATPGSQQPSLANGQDCFLAKFDAAGVRQWGTYYGGNSTVEIIADCITGPSGDVYITGATSSSVGISTPGSHQPVYGGGPNNGAGDAFLAKFNPAGVLQWGTYYGGAGSESANNVALDASGDLYFAGFSSSGTGNAIATPASHQPVFGGAYDAFLVKFDAAGIRQWGTFYGGNGQDYGGAASIDASGNVYLSGDASTNTGSSIATPCAYQPNYAGGNADAFLAKFTNTGRRLWGTYYGSVYTENSYSSYADGLGNIYLSGFTNGNSNTVVATASSHQPVYGGGNADAFLVKFDGCIPGAPVNLTPPSGMIVCSGHSTTLSTTCGNWRSLPTGGAVLGTGSTFTTGPLFADTTFYAEDFGCGAFFSTLTPVQLTVIPAPMLTITVSNPTPCVGEAITIGVTGALIYTWASPVSSSPTVEAFPLAYTTFSVTGTDANGCVATATAAVNPDLCLGIHENRTAKGIALYPNPNNGTFHVEGLTEQGLVLADELGQEIRKIALSSSNNFRVILNDLPNGIYFLTGEKDNKVLNKKIIVIR